ncbi:MAG: hypothetical protein U0836_17935 [Pirellulales bacterium]
MNAAKAKAELRDLLARADAEEAQRRANLSPEQARLELAVTIARHWLRHAVETGDAEAEKAGRVVLEEIRAGAPWWVEYANDVATKWTLEAEIKRVEADPHLMALHPQPIRHMREQLSAALARLDAKYQELLAEAHRRGLQVA